MVKKAVSGKSSALKSAEQKTLASNGKAAASKTTSLKKTDPVDPGEFGPVFEAEISAINSRRERLFGIGSKIRSQITARFFTPLVSTSSQSPISVRSAHDDEPDLAMTDLSGIAISGGGVRSAAFSIGALQAMDALGNEPDKKGKSHSVFEKMDYMSTVSGGGYTGSCISASMAADGAEFPFPSILKKTEPDVLRHIRDHSNYLFPRGGFWEKLSNLASYLRGIFANIPALAMVISAAVLLTILFKGQWAGGLAGLNNSNMATGFWAFLEWAFSLGPTSGIKEGFFQATVIAALLFSIGMIIWALKRSMLNGASADFATSGTWFWQCCIVLIALIFFVELQPKLISGLQGQYCAEVVDMNEPENEEGEASHSRNELFKHANCEETGVSWDPQTYAERVEIARFNKLELPQPSSTGVWSFLLGKLQGLTGTLTVLAGAFAAFKGIFGSGDSNSAKQQSGFSGLVKKYASTAITLLLGLLLPLIIWLVYLYLSFWSLPGVDPDTQKAYFSHQPDWLSVMGEHGITVFAVIAVVGFLVSIYVGTNENSPHNLYRDRLAAAFLVAPSKHPNGNAGEIQVDLKGDLLLSRLSQINGPFQLINSALNIQNSKGVNGRGRNAGFFTFSSSHVGSFETGYVATSDLEQVEKNFRLSSAMAISAAAASTAMGGLTKKPLALTLALLNVRLGYWFPNPREVSKLLKMGVKPAHRFFSQNIRGRSTSFIALRKEIMNDLTETGNRVYLTDGGHIENLGLYSLLKRRCKFIVVIDGEADPELNFSSFKTAQRFARIDLGTRIDLPIDQIVQSTQAAREQIHGKPVAKRVAEFSRKAEGATRTESETLPIADRVQCAIGSVVYPKDENGDSQEGTIVYIKSSLSGGENDYVLEYARKNPAFPHETTGDQFFSEEQFEAYRALGFHIMHRSLMGDSKVQSGKGKVRLNLGSERDDKSKDWDEFMGKLRARYPV